MINANKEKLASFFQGTIQYEVPFFQRAYVWEEENWITLWEHIAPLLDRSGEHFIGTIITKQRPAEALGQQVYDLIDGQQRLTTIALLLRAIGDTARGQLPGFKGVVSDGLAFRDARGQNHPRIIPSKLDEPHYNALMSQEGIDRGRNKEHKIVRVYEFFKDSLRGMSDEKLEALRLVLLERVSVISMMLSPDDDEQEIFDTINALGVRLTTAELLKNYVFKDRSIQGQYAPLWKDVYEDSDERVEFWNDNKTAGRVIRTNIEVLLYCYLVVTKGDEVKLEKLFKEYKDWLKDKKGDERIEFLKELGEYAEIYYSFPSGSELNHLHFGEAEKRFFHVIENLMITTVLPLVLYVYKNVSSLEGRSDILKLLETYLVRRNVCGLTAKNYNSVFIQMIKKLDTSKGERGTLDAQALATIIGEFDEDTNRMPTDVEFVNAFRNRALSNQNAREILFLIALRQLSGGLADLPTMSLGDYSVEHMMPVRWEANWLEREMSVQERAERDKKLKTLGNLTLVLPIGLTPKRTTSRRSWVRGRPRQGREGSGRPPSGCAAG
jgi:uncharacterized protein with ParB-like and HNH nuclease domain